MNPTLTQLPAPPWFQPVAAALQPSEGPQYLLLNCAMGAMGVPMRHRLTLADADDGTVLSFQALVLIAGALAFGMAALLYAMSLEVTSALRRELVDPPAAYLFDVLSTPFRFTADCLNGQVQFFPGA